jgi:NAD(P)-dependent dehydrogenase (short-subunit alcohol dehydrogenase family)
MQAWSKDEGDADDTAEGRGDARPSSVLQRFADPSEIASLITYVCSERASATTGSALRADGGVVRSIA